MNKPTLYPFKFKPILKQVIWGGNHIPLFKGNADADVSECIGESWEVSGVEGSVSVISEGALAGKNLTELLQDYRELLVGESVYSRYGNSFPLLLKFIDAHRDLSVQVHPNDEMARRKHQTNGKTELWYVIDAAENASLYTGFNRNTNRAEVKSKIEAKDIESLLNKEKVTRDDVIFLPAGRIHAIGKGVFLAEIQQSSNVTYRVWDYDRIDKDGKPRDLHVDLALDALDYKLRRNYTTTVNHRANQKIKINECSYFTVNLMEADTVMTFDYGRLDSFVAWMCIGGSAVYASQRKNKGFINCGETILFPACDQPKAFIPACNDVRILEIYIA